ncbi:MAG: hypothetical protein OIF48_04525 [Silicimonas sp.]|nr:hypothetical protein [Silicimonas sp.]
MADLHPVTDLARTALALLRALWPAGRPAQGALAGSGFRAIAPDEATQQDLPVEPRDPDMMERIAVSQHIAALMLADEWAEIGSQIAAWEDQLVSSCGGARYHSIGAEVALSGLQALIDDTPHARLEDLAPAEVELGHFIDTHKRHPDCHVLAALAARAHLALAEACRAPHWPEELRNEAWRRTARHVLEAGEILKSYDALAYMSPLLAEADYLCAIGAPGSKDGVRAAFDTWIDLDPSNPMIYETHARELADPDAYSDAVILAEADRATDRTSETLGAGGYALFFLPLLDRRDGARDLFDADLFAAAMLDLASMEASQAEVNQTANALAAELRLAEDSEALNDTLFMMIRGHMNVIYPRLWALPVDHVQTLVKSAALALPDMGAIANEDSDIANGDAAPSSKAA